MTGKQKIILTTTSFFGVGPLDWLSGLREQGFRVVLNPLGRKLKEDELIKLLEKHQPVGLLAGTEPITRGALERAKDLLRVISRVGTGWDNVDRNAAAEFGILVYRTVGILTQSVAELTIGLMLSALRSIVLHDRMLRQGLWQKRMGSLLQGKVLGIIGFGAIGQRVAELARAFGCEVIYYDPQPKSVTWARRFSLPQLLKEADIISIHASGKERIIGPQELNFISKRDVILVNTARGELIDEEALSSSLKEGHLGFACLDVFNEEPYCGPLCSLDNLIMTPHIGSYALEARQLMEKMAISNLMTGLQEAGVL